MSYSTESDTDYTTDDTYDSEEDDYGDFFIYEPEEQSRTKFNLVLSEIYNAKLYGNPHSSTVDASYIVIYRFKIRNCYMYEMANEINSSYLNLVQENSLVLNGHPIIRNYKNIASRSGYIKPEIAECIYMDSGHCVCILKTFWLRIIQRTWRRVFAERMRVIRERCKPAALFYRMRNGVWPDDCRLFPTLGGMLA